MTRRSSARAVADLHGGTILATVDIAAPAERVFRALTTDEAVQWWGSDEAYRTTAWESDLRVGGVWRATGVDKDGKPFSVRGSYVEIDAPRRLVQTWEPDWDSGITRVTYLLDPTSTGTRVTLRHEGFGTRTEACAGHGAGWEQVLGWLHAHMGSRSEVSKKYFVVKLLPPRPTFMADMTADERAMMGAHAEYWTQLLHQGNAIVFGPVADPAGPHGLGILAVESEAELQALLAKDPAILAQRGLSHVTAPMLQAVWRE
ncbi:MAG TPA: SRPBCC domain-containing protein [Polyangiaceae bacterium]|nr:SRPBCC domain-containing protein [Polyangiaceae bacterium]